MKFEIFEIKDMKNEKIESVVLLSCNAQPVQCAVLHDNIVPQPKVPKRPKKYQKSTKTSQKSTKINIFNFLLHKKWCGAIKKIKRTPQLYCINHISKSKV